MNDSLVAALREFTLRARGILEREAEEQLEGLYGWLPDGSFASAAGYPALKQEAEARETRSRLERYAGEEKEAGIKPADARRRLAREASFTWLNRLVALRMLEERRLIQISVGKLLKSNGFIYWLAAEGNEDSYRLHQQGELPLDALGEGPAHRAYRRYLLDLCGTLARDVSVLFDPDTLASRLFPRPTVLRELLGAMDAEDPAGDLHLAQAWKAGNEEAIGWVYESFVTVEKATVFAGFDRGEKARAEQIPAATEVFTPRWVVRFLVENSLGRLWVEMHADSALKEKLGYLVPAGWKRRPMRPVKQIRFLDPACGSMHFGLVAFDLFAEMYREELERAGQSGWPAEPSVKAEEEIPAAIIHNNLHGIDLDLRAVQLSALALYLRARSANPKCPFTDRNLACANVEQITGGRLHSLVSEAGLDHPVYARLLEALVQRFRDSDNLGSLLRPEKDIEALAEEEKRRALRGRQRELDLPGRTVELFDSQEGVATFFDTLSEEILSRLDAMVVRSRKAGSDPGHLVSEAAKGLRFARLVSHRYDVVATNPPYMNSRNMSAVMRSYLSDHLSEGKEDLYAAFILRCSELLSPAGLLAMVTQQSFMFIKSYEQMREVLRDRHAVASMAHLGPRAFAQAKGEKVNTAAFVLESHEGRERNDAATGTYFRLVKMKDAEGKRQAFEEALAALRAGTPHPLVYRYRQGDFDAIPGSPWVYWITEGIRAQFARRLSIGSLCQPVAGLRSSDNKRFLRLWWEVGIRLVGRGSLTGKDFISMGMKWAPYMKGGRTKRWWGNQECVVKWSMGGEEVGQAIIEAYPYLGRAWVGGSKFYFRRGVTWTFVSSGQFCARLSPGGFIFDVAGSSVFPENIPFILGIMNSSFSQYALKLINPTVNYQVGDLARLPVPASSSPLLESLVERAVELARQDSTEDDTTYDFIAPPAWSDGLEAVAARKSELADVERRIDEEVYRLYGIGPGDRRAIEAELASPAEEQDPVEGDSGKGEQEEPEEQLQENGDELARRWVDYAVGLSLGRFQPGVEHGLGRGRFTEAAASRLRELAASEGILALDPGQPLDLAARVLAILEAALGVEAAYEMARRFDGGASPLEALQEWLGRGFWPRHKQRYRKRPIYWPLQSPAKRYTVWVFHERLSPDSLPHIRNSLVEPRIRLAERQAQDLRSRAQSDRKLAKQADRLLELADDLRRFSAHLKEAAEAGWTPHIDDGVLLNAAPLHELLPSWPETRKAWQELSEGRYEWAGQAMAYWPDRVRKACLANRSLAIAHGLASPEDAAPVVARRGRRKQKPPELL